MRLATFNIESLDAPPRAALPLAERMEILRPQLLRTKADVLCLQEVNSQRAPGDSERSLAALKALLAETPFANFEMVASHGPGTSVLSDVHNLVTLSRLPIMSHIELKHTLVKPPRHDAITAEPAGTMPETVVFERPALIAELELPSGRRLSVVNIHLRAPLASVVPGQKQSPFSWKTTQGWAEGYYVSSLKRNAQALEIRLALDAMFDADPHHLTAVCGDFNCQDHETPMRIVQASEDDTGNPHLTARSLIVADRSLPEDRRYSVIHNGRPQMLDHILVTRSLAGYLQDVQIHNEGLTDECAAAGLEHGIPGSSHAALIADFAIG